MEMRYKPGDRIGGRYHVHQALQGGMGEVYLCLDLQERFPVALKTFQSRYLSTQKLRRAFTAEVAIWVALEKHPNIVRCYLVDTFDDQPFMMLEWVIGEEGYGTDLRSRLHRGALSLRHSLSFAIDVCRGLAHAGIKQPGIIHRDLKPENVLISQGDTAKITDFGLAKIAQAIDAEPDEPRGGPGLLLHLSNMGGTPPYMAPEQWAGEPLDVRTDIYAVGCILYEMLTGRRPFFGPTLGEYERQHLNLAAPDLGGEKGVPSSLNAIIKRCLAKAREERFDTPDHLLRELSAVFNDLFHESPPPITVSDQFTATDYSDRGATYARLEMHDNALKDYEQAISLDPSLARPYFNRARTYSTLRRNDEALANYLRAVELNPDYTTAHNNLGIVYERLGRHDEAMESYGNAIRIDPTFATTYINRGTLHSNLSRHEEALADYDRAVELNPADPLAYINRARLYNQMEFYDKSLEEYDRAVALFPTDAQCYLERGALYEQLGRHGEAIADYTRVLDVAPTYVDAYYRRGGLYLTENKYFEALADYNKAIELDPGNAKLFTHRGVAYEKLLRFDAALADHTRSLQLDPSYGVAYYNRGVIHILLENFAAAVADFDQAVKFNFTLPRVFITRGRAYDGLHRHAEAIADMTRALEADPEDAGTFSNRSLSYQALGQHQLAQADLLRAIELNPSFATAYYNLGLLYAAMNRYDEALSAFARLIELEPDRPSHYYRRGHLYQDQHRHDEAMKDFDSVLRLDPTNSDAFLARGYSHMAQENYSAALDDFAKAIRFDQSNETALYNMGMLLSHLGELAQALPYLKKAALLGNELAAQTFELIRQHPDAESFSSINPAQIAFDTFKQTNSLDEMREAVTNHPFLAEPVFFTSLERLVMARAGSDPHLQQRFKWLRQVLDERK